MSVLRFRSTPIDELMAEPDAKQGRKEAFREGFIHALNAMRDMRRAGFGRADEIANVLEMFAALELKAWSFGRGEAWISKAPKAWNGRSWWDIRQQVLDRDGHRCADCGSTEGLQIDHVHPVAKGGRPVLENLQVLCKTCNLQKGAR